jgi:hypothetical protein
MSYMGWNCKANNAASVKIIAPPGHRAGRGGYVRNGDIISHISAYWWKKGVDTDSFMYVIIFTLA